MSASRLPITSYGRSFTFAYPALKAQTFPAKWRSGRSCIRTSSIQSYLLAYLLTIASVSSVDPSLTTSHFIGSSVWEITDVMASSINYASLRAGVMSTYFGVIGIMQSPNLELQLGATFQRAPRLRSFEWRLARPNVWVPRSCSRNDISSAFYRYWSFRAVPHRHARYSQACGFFLNSPGVCHNDRCVLHQAEEIKVAKRIDKGYRRRFH